MDKKGLALLLAMLISACQASATPQATPADLEEVVVTPALLPQAAGWVQEYREETGQILFNLIPMPYSAGLEAAENGDAGVVIAAQTPTLDWWAIPLITEPVAVVVHTENNIGQLSRSELIQILSGQVTDWETWTGQPQAIQVIFPLPGDDIRTRFLELLSPGLRLAAGTRLAPGPNVLADWVAQEPGAIGILPYTLVTDSLVALEIDGAAPDERNYGYFVDIIATAPEEPEGNIRSWLLWLQDRFLEAVPAPAETEGPTTTAAPSTPTASDSPEGTTTAPPSQTPAGTQTQ